jgi:hypothetical protein
MSKSIQISENKLFNIIKESIFECLNESRQGIQSKKIYDIIKQHGGLSKEGKMRANVYDIHNMVDSDVIDVISKEQLQDIYLKQERKNPGCSLLYAIEDYYENKGLRFNQNDTVSTIGLKDGYYIIFIARNTEFDRYGTQDRGGWYNTYKKRDDREKSKMNDGSKQYQWSNPEAYELGLRNPFYKQWSRDSKTDFMNKMRDSYNRK